MAGDQRHGALGERSHGLAQVHVERVQVGGQRADLVDHGRHDELHRLGEAEALDPDQVVDRPVEVHRVRAAVGDLDPERARLLPELLDRVDLAVVAEDRKRLHAPERRPGVRRVPVVAEAGRGLEALVSEVEVVGAEHARRAHDLVDARRRRERCHVEGELGLELGRQRVERPVPLVGRREQAAELPEVGLLLACGGAQRLRLDGAEALGQDSHAGAAQKLAGVVQRPLDVLGALDEHVADRERRLVGERRAVASGPHLLGPDPPGDVDQQAAAVALAVHVAGAVEHLLEVRERELNGRAARRRVLADRGVDRTCVVVVDRGRRDERTPGQVRRVTIQLGLPGSAPSSSGRATGTRGSDYTVGRSGI